MGLGKEEIISDWESEDFHGRDVRWWWWRRWWWWCGGDGSDGWWLLLPVINRARGQFQEWEQFKQKWGVRSEGNEGSVRLFLQQIFFK